MEQKQIHSRCFLTSAGTMPLHSLKISKCASLCRLGFQPLGCLSVSSPGDYTTQFLGFLPGSIPLKETPCFPRPKRGLASASHVSSVSCYWNNIADKGTLKKKGFSQLMVCKGMWSIMEAKAWSHSIQSGSRKKSVGFRLFI